MIKDGKVMYNATVYAGFIGLLSGMSERMVPVFNPRLIVTW
jgi:hypothetical protein